MKKKSSHFTFKSGKLIGFELHIFINIHAHNCIHIHLHINVYALVNEHVYTKEVSKYLWHAYVW